MSGLLEKLIQRRKGFPNLVCPPELTPVNDTCPAKFPKLYVYKKGDRVFKCCQKEKILVRSGKDRDRECEKSDLKYLPFYDRPERSQSIMYNLKNTIKMSYADILMEGNLRCIDPGSKTSSLDQILDGLEQETPSASWLVKQARFISSLTTKEKDFIRLYTYKGDSILNAFLRQGYTLTPDNMRYIGMNMVEFRNTLSRYNTVEEWLLDFQATLSNVISRAPVSEQRLIVWRGQRDSDNFNRGTVNRIYQSSGMLSTSIFAKVSYRGFTGQQTTIPHMVKIIVPEGMPCLYIESNTNVVGEFEILFDHGSAYYIINDVHKVDRVFNLQTSVPIPNALPSCAQNVTVHKPKMVQYTTNTALLVRIKGSVKTPIRAPTPHHLVSDVLPPLPPAPVLPPAPAPVQDTDINLPPGLYLPPELMKSLKEKIAMNKAKKATSQPKIDQVVASKKPVIIVDDADAVGSPIIQSSNMGSPIIQSPNISAIDDMDDTVPPAPPKDDIAMYGSGEYVPFGGGNDFYGPDEAKSFDDSDDDDALIYMSD